MTRPLRIEFPGSFWHITQRGNEQRPMFRDDVDCVRFLELLGDAVQRFEWIVTAFALMLNHYHLAIEVTASNTLSRGLMWLNGKYARSFNRRHKRVGHLVQGRPFERLIEKEGYFLEVLRYVVLNPVRATLVDQCEDYRWTSYRATAGLTAAPDWLAVDEVLARFAPARQTATHLYRQFVREGIGSTNRPWDDAVGSMYLGSTRWLEDVRERVEAQPRVTEHPREQRELLRPNISQIIATVSTTMALSEERVRHGRGGSARLVAAWLGCYEGHLTNGEIAAGLRLRSNSHVTTMIADCESELRASAGLRGAIDDCLATLRRKNRQPQT
jgi:putative transposase